MGFRCCNDLILTFGLLERSVSCSRVVTLLPTMVVPSGSTQTEGNRADPNAAVDHNVKTASELPSLKAQVSPADKPIESSTAQGLTHQQGLWVTDPILTEENVSGHWSNELSACNARSSVPLQVGVDFAYSRSHRLCLVD